MSRSTSGSTWTENTGPERLYVLDQHQGTKCCKHKDVPSFPGRLMQQPVPQNLPSALCPSDARLSLFTQIAFGGLIISI